MRPSYDPALPITAHREEILEALARHPVIVVCGATGSGKTTQLPKLCLEAGRGVAGMIGHTQPRRIAARSLAQRIAMELGTTVGGEVGFQVRFTDRTGPRTRIKLMTDGILLRELEHDRGLRRYDTLIIDEAHERSLNIDLLLGVLKRLVPERPELRVIVTSATIDPGRFADFFGGAPVIEVSGRSFPVEVRYRPLLAEDEDAAVLSLPEGIVAAVRELYATAGGDALVFLPGEKQIREAAEALARAGLRDTEILPLYARLTARDQERIFAPHTQRRIVLATNVAETALTVPGVRHVVDSGLARISRYSVRGKVQRLPVEPVSKASAEQRKGRCGREAPGICIRLYSQEDFERREEFTPPEVLRTNLASVILQMAERGLGEPEGFPFLDPPDTRLVNDGVRLLQELGAMDDERRVTKLGRQIAALPVDPRLARILLAASRQQCLSEMLVIAAFLEAQDPRERPAEAQRQADEGHALFAHRRSDFLMVLKLWQAFSEQAATLSGSQLRKWCREHFLSFVRMREWQELHAQLADAVAELRLVPNRRRPGYTALHRAILSGFLGSVGRLGERGEYSSPRGGRFRIAPGTPLAKHNPRWVVAASLIETTRVYARMVAAIEPRWIEAAAGPQLRRAWDEVHWNARRGYVAAWESASLHGLTLAARRLVNFGPVDPAVAHEVFVREALVEGRANPDAPFLEANRRLRTDIERMEAKIRRRDILVDEETQVAFYLARIPQRVSTLAAFEHWRAEAEREQPQLLFMSATDLMRRSAPEAAPEHYPDEIHIGESRLPLDYRFEPGASDDGVTLTVPAALLESLDADRLAWLVPGMRAEKITTLMRSLPIQLRRQLVPVPESAQQALAESRGTEEGFHRWMARWITRRTGAPVSAAELAELPLPEHLRLNVRVLDPQDYVIATGRDLAALKRSTAVLVQPGRVSEGDGTEGGSSTPVPLHREWDFGELPERIVVERNRVQLVAWPALEDRGNGVALRESYDAGEALALTRRGIARLAMFALPQQLRHFRATLAADRELILLGQGVGLERPLPDALTERAFLECFVPEDEPLPRDRGAFEARIASRRGALEETVAGLTERVRAVLAARHAVRAALEPLRSPAFEASVADVEEQLALLLAPGFLATTPQEWLERLPVYLEAIRRRIERLRGNVVRDAKLMEKVRPFVLAWRALGHGARGPANAAALVQLRWMIEEFRVSLFAQELGTALRISGQRLEAQVERVTVGAPAASTYTDRRSKPSSSGWSD